MRKRVIWSDTPTLLGHFFLSELGFRGFQKKSRSIFKAQPKFERAKPDQNPFFEGLNHVLHFRLSSTDQLGL